MKKDDLSFFWNLLLFSAAISFFGSCSDDDGPPPSVVSMNPDTGYPESLITITGSNFYADNTTVSFNGIAADIKILITVPIP